jgi:hypothetical protein
VLVVLAPGAILAPTATARGSDTIYDEAGVLSEAEEQRVQEGLDRRRGETGQSIYALLVPDKGVESEQAWVTTHPIFEALDNDYVYMAGAPGDTSFGDWSGGDRRSGDWSGGDWGGEF